MGTGDGNREWELGRHGERAPGWDGTRDGNQEREPGTGTGNGNGHWERALGTGTGDGNQGQEPGRGTGNGNREQTPGWDPSGTALGMGTGSRHREWEPGTGTGVGPEWDGTGMGQCGTGMGTGSRHWDWALGWDGEHWGGHWDRVGWHREQARGWAPDQDWTPGMGTEVGTGMALGWDGTGTRQHSTGMGPGQSPGWGQALQQVPGPVPGSQGVSGPSGTACRAASPVRVPALPCPPRRYMCSLSLFHYSEYLVTAINNPRSLSLDSFLLNHSFEYNLAALSSWVEFTLEKLLVPGQLGWGGAEPPMGVFLGLRNEWHR